MKHTLQKGVQKLALDDMINLKKKNKNDDFQCGSGFKLI